MKHYINFILKDKYSFNIRRSKMPSSKKGEDFFIKKIGLIDFLKNFDHNFFKLVIRCLILRILDET